MPKEFRRIVTANRPSGHSYVWKDGPPPRILGQGARLAEIWMTDRSPAGNSGQEDAGERVTKLEPPANGTIFRYFELPPEDPHVPRQTLETATQEAFAAFGASHCLVDTTKYPSMHKTKTVDYIILLSGRVTLMLDEDEVDLEPFDVVVQRGTNHAWINKGPDRALLVAVLVDSEPGQA